MKSVYLYENYTCSYIPKDYFKTIVPSDDVNKYVFIPEDIPVFSLPNMRIEDIQTLNEALQYADEDGKECMMSSFEDETELEAWLNEKGINTKVEGLYICNYYASFDPNLVVWDSDSGYFTTLKAFYGPLLGWEYWDGRCWHTDTFGEEYQLIEIEDDFDELEGIDDGFFDYRPYRNYVYKITSINNKPTQNKNLLWLWNPNLQYINFGFIVTDDELNFYITEDSET